MTTLWRLPARVVAAMLARGEVTASDAMPWCSGASTMRGGKRAASIAARRSAWPA
ncbi:hypothetical protein [Elioraea sp.]|uniref:hypothetical protein n=1 Tax=Elioraea sp. TaxID=2185103 RepID=UPI0025B88F40|nr:hypothetical protein [Elioraea sp.]